MYGRHLNFCIFTETFFFWGEFAHFPRKYGKFTFYLYSLKVNNRNEPTKADKRKSSFSVQRIKLFVRFCFMLFYSSYLIPKTEKNSVLNRGMHQLGNRWIPKTEELWMIRGYTSTFRPLYFSFFHEILFYNVLHSIE